MTKSYPLAAIVAGQPDYARNRVAEVVLSQQRRGETRSLTEAALKVTAARRKLGR